MPSNSQSSSGSVTFYNDMHTTHTALSTPQQTAHTASNTGLARITALESKLDSIFFILSSQSHNLQILSTKFNTLCEITGVDIPDDKPVAARMKDYEMKFTQAKENAEEAVLERKRTNSNADKGTVGKMPERKRAMSITRSCRDVKVNLHLLALINSVSVIDQKCQLTAVEHEALSTLLSYANASLRVLYNDNKSSGNNEEATEIELETGKWRMTLEEEGHAAELTRSPTRLTGIDVTDEEIYKGWYYRNVLKGKKMEFEVQFRVEMKTGYHE